jgi:hypothetical protein
LFLALAAQRLARVALKPDLPHVLHALRRTCLVVLDAAPGKCLWECCVCRLRCESLVCGAEALGCNAKACGCSDEKRNGKDLMKLLFHLEAAGGEAVGDGELTRNEWYANSASSRM